ncbi:Oxoglutarate/iron-dependent dioxygenase [Macleaya cordata]|uniref:Oxoglutarate/iron-dependent dioxygenase n=1 Tax=Macleaya cordata TaxID=56857 RepID=A0A200Q6K1_MACCD|nr:Oxoglutarate/iron-dependent dioxygenase [Macleaya cordata]
MEVDRRKDVKDFDDSKVGVKGLLDSSGTTLTTIPLIFVHPPDQRFSDLKPTSAGEIPVIDFSGLVNNSDHQRRPEIVNQIREAASTWGFFQVINHGIPRDVINRIISAVRSFHEQPMDIKKMFYGRGQSVCFLSNSDLYQSKAASWRDTLKVVLGPEPPKMEKIPEVCRDEVIMWAHHEIVVGEMLMELMSEGLGVGPGRLKEMGCLESRIMLGQYYPYCPQPDLTVGIVPHTDQSIVTLLVQDQVGGLQVKHGEEWVNVKPIEGAITVNVGDFLQVISNDKYKSGEHRVLANGSLNSRVSIPFFFHPAASNNTELDTTDYYGPLPELLSPNNPPLYRNFTLSEFWRQARSKELCMKNLMDGFKIVRGHQDQRKSV